MKKTEPLNQEEFDVLLAWLDPDRDRSGEILYEEIRVKLVKIMVRRQCHAAEELADETINRVGHQVKNIASTYVGNPALWFHGVLKKVYLEWINDPVPEPLPSDPILVLPPEPDPDVCRIHDCLEKCLQELDENDRELILKYHEKEKRSKIDLRKKMADSLGLTQNGLRMRVYRIKQILEKCIVKCLNDAGSSEASDVFAG